MFPSDLQASYQQNILFPHVEMVAEWAGGRQEGRHDHHQRNDGGYQGVRAPLVGRVQTGVLAPLMWTISSQGRDKREEYSILPKFQGRTSLVFFKYISDLRLRIRRPGLVNILVEAGERRERREDWTDTGNRRELSFLRQQSVSTTTTNTETE